MSADAAATARGIVTSVSARSVHVHVPGTGDISCRLRGNLFRRRSARRAWVETDETRPVAVGDGVTVALGDGEGAVESVDERRNCLSRQPPKGRAGRRQVIAANIDRLIVVAALADPPFRSGLVDRFLVAAAMEGIEPWVCLNKVDLEGTTLAEAGEWEDDSHLGLGADTSAGSSEAGPAARARADRSVVAPYRAAGLSVLETSCSTEEGIDTLRQLMSHGISLLVGHSGVGKSSLLNSVSPGLNLATGEVAEHGRGRHTTTRVTLLPLVSGGWVVDSPGIREFGLDKVPPRELARLYPGFGTLPDACRFNDCLHRGEPGCAVRAAADEGRLSPERFECYLRVLDEVDTASWE